MISLTAASIHLINATAHGPAYASLHSSAPLQWVAKSLGRTLATSSSKRSMDTADYSWRGDSDSDDAEEQGFGGTLREGGECYHEDGGRMAVFEEIFVPVKATNVNKTMDKKKCEGADTANGGPVRPSKLQQYCIEPDVVLGSTYRVISCACAKDWRLKDEDEWCSFCRCKFCGGRERYYARSASRDSDFLSRGRMPLDEISANVYLAALLVLIAAFVHIYAADSPHRHLYLLGGTASAFLCRDAAVWLELLRP